MKKSLIIELILFIVLMSVLAYFGIKIFKHTFDIGTTYHIEFTDIDSIGIGSPVRFAGVDVGHVTKIKGTSDKVYVDFVVTNEHVKKLPEGTKATIAFFGIAGSRSIELLPPKKNERANGIIVSNPIRIGSALNIVGEFIRVSMISIGGLYEFAKDKTQAQVEDMTNNFLRKTNSADDIIVEFTDNLMHRGEQFHNGINDTVNGMNRVYTEATVLNVPADVNVGKYAANLTKRSLINLNNNIKVFEDNSIKCSNELNVVCHKADSAVQTAMNINNGISKAFQALDNALEKLDKNFTQENLDKVYDELECLKVYTDNLQRKI